MSPIPHSLDKLRLATLQSSGKRMIFVAAMAALVLFHGVAQAQTTTAAEPTQEIVAIDKPHAAAPLSLRELIDFALSHNPEVAATALDGDAAAARKRGAEAARFPRISLEGGPSYYGDDQRLIPARYNGEPGVFGSNVLSADLVLRVPLYSGGRLAAEVRIAELLEASALQRLARSKSDLVYNVSSFFFSLLAQERLIVALSISRDSLQSQLDRVNALLAEHKVAKVDILRTEVKLADVQQRLLREQNNLEVLRCALLNLVGDRTASLQIAQDVTLSAPAVDARDPHALAESALEHRSDIAAARAELQAQSVRIDEARAGNKPVINLAVAGSSRNIFAPTQQPSGLSNWDASYRLALTFEIPVYDGGRTTARVDEESAKLSAQRERLDKLNMQACLEIETAHAGLSSALERLAGADQVVSLAAENLRIEQEKYELGSGTVFFVLDAQSVLMDAQATQIRALADANISAAQLTWAIGENLP
jgi:outer membrane protein